MKPHSKILLIIYHWLTILRTGWVTESSLNLRRLITFQIDTQTWLNTQRWARICGLLNQVRIQIVVVEL